MIIRSNIKKQLNLIPISCSPSFREATERIDTQKLISSCDFDRSRLNKLSQQTDPVGFHDTFWCVWIWDVLMTTPVLKNRSSHLCFSKTKWLFYLTHQRNAYAHLIGSNIDIIIFILLLAFKVHKIFYKTVYIETHTNLDWHEGKSIIK